jgi:hypothetical protein
MQRRVRDTLGDPEQVTLYTDMTKKVIYDVIEGVG